MTNGPTHDEIEAFFEQLHIAAGYDFRRYSRASRRRRLLAVMELEKHKTLGALTENILTEPAALERLVAGLGVPATAMFRNPEMFRTLANVVLPRLATYPTLRVWVAGCATGEEAWSMAILLAEAGLGPRSRIYATDMSSALLEKARSGIYPLSQMEAYARHYAVLTGEQLSRHYTAAYGFAKIDAQLRPNVLFGQHNLVTDGPFNEFQLVLCRNVMIYFEDPLQQRVHQLLYESLAARGVLVLGATERLPPPWNRGRYEEISARDRVFRKLAPV